MRSVDEIQEIVENNPFAGEEFEDKLFHVVFLSEKLSPEKTEMLLANSRDEEKFAVREREIYCLLKNGVADSLLGKKYIDNKLKTPATARNWRSAAWSSSRSTTGSAASASSRIRRWGRGRTGV